MVLRSATPSFCRALQRPPETVLENADDDVPVFHEPCSLGTVAGKGQHDLVQQSAPLPRYSAEKNETARPARTPRLARKASRGHSSSNVPAQAANAVSACAKAASMNSRSAFCRQPNNGRAICQRVGRVRHIGHLLAGCDRQHAAQRGERQFAHTR